MNNPDDLSGDIEKLEERQAYLEKVKRSYLKAKEAIPNIQQDIDLTNWQIRAYRDMPPESVEIPIVSRQRELEGENQFLRSSITVLNIPSEPQFNSSGSIVVSSGSAIFSTVNRITDLGTPTAIAYGKKYKFEYDQLQSVQQRPQQVRIQLEKIKSKNLLERFDNAYNSYLAFRSGAGLRTSTANEIRNLLLGFKGELFTLARRFPKEDMTWDRMAARIAINGGSGTEHIILISQNRVHSSLLSRLAEVLKNREGGSLTDLDSIWTETLDHIYTVLGLIE
jgi:hypothetical protein